MINDFQLSADSDLIDNVPIVLYPIFILFQALAVMQYEAFALAIFVELMFLQQLFYCLEIFGIIWMGRTYQQVNNSEKY